MATVKDLTVERYVGDERDIVFYMIDSNKRTEILTGAVLSCKFTDKAAAEAEINTSIVLYIGDGRAHIPIVTSQIDGAIVWDLFITGTDAAGDDIAPIIGTMTVVEP